MNRIQYIRWVFGLVIVGVTCSMSAGQEPAPPAGAEVQTRGPVHDAIAQPFGVKPEPGPMVPKEPPPLIAEEPPAQKPDIDSAQWIPGYWAWDSQRQEFMWVSGVYRVPPQDRSYVPGYWSQAPEGWRWVAGFWSNARLQDTTYTPEPPAPLDANGPALPAPDENSLYVPGTWVWQVDRFVWRPGYWSAAQDGRVWVPPHYLWTPNGYVYVDGYWDYPLEDRGLMFAPAYFSTPLWTNPDWSYQPSFIVNPANFFDSAFVYGGAYYFGNYYNPFYARAGYNPWYTGRGRYDPLFAYHGLKTQRNNPNWLTGVQQTFAGRSAGRLPTPALTFAQQGKAPVVTPLKQASSNKVQIVNTTPAQVATHRAAVVQTRQLAVTRQQLESAGAGKAMRGNETRSLRLTAGGSQGNSIDAAARGAAALPKTINEPRSFTPTPAGSKVANAPTTLDHAMITPSQPALKIAAPQTAPAPKSVTPIRTSGPVVNNAANKASAPPQRTVGSAPAPIRMQPPAAARSFTPGHAGAPAHAAPAHAAAPAHHPAAHPSGGNGHHR